MVGARRLAAVLAVALLATSASTAGAGPRERDRVLAGHVTTGAQDADTTSAAICSWQAAGEASQGVVGWVVPLTAREGDGHHAFTLHLKAPPTPFPEALRVTLFRDLGTCGRDAHRTFAFAPGEHDLPRPILRGSRYLVVTMHSHVAAGTTYFVVPYVVPPGVLQDFVLRITAAPPATKRA